MPNQIAQSAMLAQPPTVPGMAPGNTQSPYSVLAGTTSGQAGMPFGSGTTVSGSGNLSTAYNDNNQVMVSAPGSGGAITGAGALTGGGNVAGVMGMGEQEDYTTDIPEITDPIVEETEEWQTADEEGFQRTNKKGEKVGKEKTGRAGARKAKRQDRKEDRWKRQGRTEILDEDGNPTGEWTGKDKDKKLRGRAKRQARRAQKDIRKQAWKNYKDDQKLADYEEAYN